MRVVRRSWANSHTPKPEGVFHDLRRSACASVASVWGSQHVMSQVTCTVHGPLGWVVACATRQGQCVCPAAPPRALDRSQRLVPVPPLAGGFGVRECLSSTGVRNHAVSARCRARRAPYPCRSARGTAPLHGPRRSVCSRRRPADSRPGPGRLCRGNSAPALAGRSPRSCGALKCTLAGGEARP